MANTLAAFERLTAWQACYRLALEIYCKTAPWPKHELYGLTSQMRRAAYSAAANIAEGAAKRGPREFRRYLDISLGSLAELTVGLRLARDTGLLTEADWEALNQLHKEAGALTGALARAIRKAALLRRPMAPSKAPAPPTV